MMSDDRNLREAGRGFILITGAKLWFLVTATFTSLAFPRLFGDPALFGQYRVVSGILNVVTMVVITASVQAVSKLASEPGADLRQVRRTSLLGQALLFGPVFLIFAALSGVVSSRLLKDPGIAAPLLISSLVVGAYVVYAALIGLLNGTRNFGRQAGMDILFSTLKTVLMILAIVASGSVALAFGGFAATALVVLVVAAFMTHGVVSRSPAGNVQPRLLSRYFGYLLPLAAYALVLNLLLQADVIWLKASLGRVVDGLTAADAASRASKAAGIYGAARNVALLPYQAVISLTFIVFPLVSCASSSGDREGASRIVGGAFRLAAVLSWAAVAMFGAAPGELLGLLFGGDYRSAGPELLILLAAGAMLAFMYVANAVLASSGRPFLSVVAGLAAVLVQGGLLFATPRMFGLADWGFGAALATLAGALCGTLIAGGVTAWIHGGRAWVWTLISSLIAATVAIGVVLKFAGSLPWPLRILASGLVFVVMLVATRGMGRSDLAVVLRVFRSRTAK